MERLGVCGRRRQGVVEGDFETRVHVDRHFAGHMVERWRGRVLMRLVVRQPFAAQGHFLLGAPSEAGDADGPQDQQPDARPDAD